MKFSLSGKWLAILAALLVISLAVGCSTKPEPAVQLAKPVELHVSAALGLKEALLDIQKDYEKNHPQVKIVYNLAASGVLAAQIEQGAPADLFIAAANKQMNDLEAKGLIVPTTRRPLVGNDLVLITAKDRKLPINSFEELTKAASFGLGAPETVPVGQYGIEVMRKLKIWETVKDKAVLAKDVRTIVAYVETGNVDAGIVFSTVAALSDKVVIAARAPAGTHEPIIFPATMLKNAGHPKEAADFLAYLAGPNGMKAFEKYGFRPLATK